MLVQHNLLSWYLNYYLVEGINKLIDSLNSYCCFAILESTLLITYLLGIVYNKEISEININFISYTLLIL